MVLILSVRENQVCPSLYKFFQSQFGHRQICKPEKIELVTCQNGDSITTEEDAYTEIEEKHIVECMKLIRQSKLKWEIQHNGLFIYLINSKSNNIHKKSKIA